MVDDQGLYMRGLIAFLQQVDGGAAPYCGIHNEQPFLEVHTQIHGLGIMQVLADSSIASRSGAVYMAPGYTHEPFAGPSLVCPWHQVVAVSDCLWLAMGLHLS